MANAKTVNNQKFIEEFVRVATTDQAICAYSGPEAKLKERFHHLGRIVLRLIAAKLRLGPGQYEIHSNKGGVAVSGEVWLYTPFMFLEFSQTSLGPQFMYRTCEPPVNGRWDSGSLPKHGNRWMPYKQLLDLDKACEAFARLKPEA